MFREIVTNTCRELAEIDLTDLIDFNHVFVHHAIANRQTLTHTSTRQKDLCIMSRASVHMKFKHFFKKLTLMLSRI